MNRDENHQSIQISGKRLRVGDISQHASHMESPLPSAPRAPTLLDAQGQRPIRILFMAANPSGTSRLRIDQEARAVDDALRTSGHSGRFELDQRWAVTAADMAESLLRFEPMAVHVSGHGGAASLALESDPLVIAAGRPAMGRRDVAATAAKTGSDENAEGEAPLMAALAGLFASAGHGIRSVVLNACHSARLAEAIAKHVDCSIGMSGAIGDLAAILFARGYYNALGYGRSVQTAFELACQQLTAVGLADARVPRLFAHRCDPRQCVLVSNDPA